MYVDIYCLAATAIASRLGLPCETGTGKASIAFSVLAWTYWVTETLRVDRKCRLLRSLALNF